MLWKRVVLVNLIAILGYINPAQAITAALSAGTTGPGGATNQGTYTNERGATTVDFNGGTAPTTGFARYSGITGASKITADAYAPPGPSNQTNTSSYLAVFSGNAVTIQFSSYLNYFGLDWGFADGGNKIDFYRGSSSTTPYQSFTASNIPLTTNPEQSAYVVFKSTNNTTDTFDRVVLTSASGGFETDNHSYRAIPFKLSPGLGILMLGALGATAHIKSRMKNVDVLTRES